MTLLDSLGRDRTADSIPMPGGWVLKPGAQHDYPMFPAEPGDVDGAACQSESPRVERQQYICTRNPDHPVPHRAATVLEGDLIGVVAEWTP